MSREAPDLKLLAFVALAVPVTWLVFLGWDARGLVLGGDSLREIPWLKRVLDASADWQRLLYVPEIIGGTKLTPVLGILPIYRLAALLQLAPILAMNLAALTTQMAIGFLGIRACENLSALWSGAANARNYLARLGLLWLIAFSPVIAWRFSAGHLNLILGLALFLCLLASIASIGADDMTITLVVVIASTLGQCLLSNGHQTKLYSVVFGLPILLGVGRTAARPYSKAWLRRGAWLGALWVGSVLVVLPDFLGFITNLRRGDGARILGADSVIYSYTTATLRDWLTSIPWAHELFASGRSIELQHEINYAIGPVLLLALLLYRRRAVALGLCVSLVGVVVFASNIKPFADWFPLLLPPLNGFRVPARAVLPFCLALPILVGAQLLVGHEQAFEWKRDLLYGVIGVVLVVLLPPALRELLLWILAAYAVAIHFRVKSLPGQISLSVLLVVLGAGSLMAFKQRTVAEFPRDESILAGLDEITAKLRTQRPEITNPLNRVLMPVEVEPYWVNSGVALGVSTLSGYFYPTWRYLKLLAGLSQIPYDPTLVLFDIQGGSTAFPYLQQLYNVGAELQSDGKVFSFHPLPTTPGNAWLARRSAWLDSSDALVAKLTDSKAELKSAIEDTVWLVRDDPYFKNRFDTLDCEQGRVFGSRALRDETKWEFEVEASGTCALVVATNYVSNVKAYVAGRELKVFPADGALTGVIVPSGKSTITLAVQDERPAWSFWLVPVGFVLLVVAAILCLPAKVKAAHG